MSLLFAVVLTVTSALSLNATNHTVTLPLFKEQHGGVTAWYIVTDASDKAIAKRYRVNYAPSLSNLGNDAIARLETRSAPDFSATRTYVASETGFPPKSATPGAVADDGYSPFVREKGVAGVLNAPIVATGDGAIDVATHTNTQDRVIAIDTQKMTVTLVLARGFVNGKPVYYISTEASEAVPSSVERATLAPRLKKASADARIPIGVVVNGPRTSSPQGLAFLTLDTPIGEDATATNVATIMSSFNVLSIAPDPKAPYAENGYSPLWNVVVNAKPQSKRITSFADLAATMSPGFIVNCPVIAYGDASY